MVRRFFDTWLAASEEAKEAAKTFNCNATVGRDDCMFYVEIPSDVPYYVEDLEFEVLWNDRSIAERHADQQLFSQITERISTRLGGDIPNKERKKLFYYSYQLARIPPFSLRFILEKVVEEATPVGGKDILETLSSKWALALVLFFGWGFVWNFVCKYIEKKTGLSRETTFFFTFMPSFSVFGYLVGKLLECLRQPQIDN